MPWRWGIKGKLMATVTLIILTALFILGLFTYRESRSVLEKELVKRVRVEFDWWAHQAMVDWLGGLKGLTVAMAGFPETQEMLAVAAENEASRNIHRRFLKVTEEFLRSHPAVVGVTLVRPDGREVVRLERKNGGGFGVSDSGENWRSRRYFSEALQLGPGTAVVTDIHSGQAGKGQDAQSFLCVGRPVSVQGVTYGLLIVDADFGTVLQSTPETVRRASASESCLPKNAAVLQSVSETIRRAVVYLVDKDGNIFYRAKPAGRSGDDSVFTTADLRKVEPGLANLLKTEEEFLGFMDENHLYGFTRVYFDRPHSDRFFAVVYYLPQETLLSGAKRVRGVFLIAGLAVFLVSLLAVHTLARAVARPVLNLAAVADRVAKGDLSKDAGPMPRQDEIGGLYRSFNAMIAGLRESRRAEEERVRLLEAASQAAIDVSRELSVSVILDKLVHLAVNFLDADCACLHLASGQEGRDFFAAGQGSNKCAVLEKTREKGLVAAVFQTGQAVRLREAEIAAGPYRLLPPDGEAFLGVPVFSEGRVIGALCIGSGKREIGSAGEAAIRLLAAHAGVAVANARLHEEVVSLTRELEQRVEERTRKLREMNLELERANRLKSEFLATMSHELRTPLNTIIGFTDVLLHDVVPETAEKTREYLQDIMESAEHLLSLINDVLDLAKIEAGKEELFLEEVTVPDLVRGVAVLFREKAAHHGIEITLDITGAGEWVLDVRKFKQILFNLLSNAFKFTPDGGKVGIEAKVEGDLLVVTVWDTGIGISSEDMPRLFKPFEQLDSSLARRYPGTGLGLAMVKKLTELHGGTISVASKPGEGSRFTIRLPRLSLRQ